MSTQWLGPGFGQNLMGNDYMGNPKKPLLPEIPEIKLPDFIAPPASTEKEVEEVKNEEKEKIKKRKKQTILTGPQGILSPANVQYKTLLGE